MNPSPSDSFCGASISNCIGEWSKITSCETVLNWVAKGVSIPFVNVPNEPVRIQYHKHFSSEENAFIDKEVKKLCSQKCVVLCKSKPQFISPLSVAPKADGDYRLILDLRELNKYCKPKTFIHEDINTVINLIKPEDALVTLDLKSAFFHIPVSKEHSTYLGFEWKGLFYKFVVLPFGACFSPYFCYKLVRPIIQFFRQRHNLRIIAYVDDFLLGDDEQRISDSLKLVVETLQKLGWFINLKKSDLTPSCSKQFIGFVIDTKARSNSILIKVPCKRIQKLKRDIKRLLLRGKGTARFIARVCGQIVSMTKAILPAKLLLRNLYRLLALKTSWQEVLTVDVHSREDLEWWFDSLSAWNGRYYSMDDQKKPVIQIATDASSSGFGGIIVGTDAQTQGFWPNYISRKCSNYREIMAVYMTLLSFKEIIRGHTIQILSDNITTVSYLACMGGPSKQISDIATDIWSFAVKHNISISSKYLPGIQNEAADRLSRLKCQYEWRLHSRIFNLLNLKWGPFTVDRFASLSTAQIQTYNSWYLDPMTSGVDAFSQNWSNHNNFINPPLRLMNRILDKIVAEKAVATIICPAWPAQSWFQRLRAICVCPPLKLPKSKYICIPLSAKKPEPLKNPNWRLFAWRVDGNAI